MPSQTKQTKRSPGLPEDPEDFRASLGDHLEELRTRILRVLGLVGLGWVVGWFLQPHVYTSVQAVVRENIHLSAPGVRFEEAFRNAPEAFMLQLKLSLLIGVVLVLPFVALQLWGFVAPGLTHRERRPVRFLAPLSGVLFVAGATFCWFIVPAAIRWFGSFLTHFPGASLIQEPGSMVMFVLKLMMAFGIGFQLPLIVYLLGVMNVLSASTMLSHWRQVAVGIFLASALITPPDVFSQIMMGLPLVVLYVGSCYAVRLTERRRKRRSAQ
jgi:sec-independent protein translocase protein TatC